MTWPKLKQIIMDTTTNVRLKKYISNRTKTTFDEILLDVEKFDRLLNGRWISRPREIRSKRGGTRMSNGRRSEESIEGFQNAIIPIINYIIQNKLDNSSILEQSIISNVVKWFMGEHLKLNNVPKREIDISNKLLNNFDEFITDSNIDFRKLNFDYITNAISKRLQSLMTIPQGTNIKCIETLRGNNTLGRDVLTKDKYYEVIFTMIHSGRLMVRVIDDMKYEQYYHYSYFEDMAIHRNDLLNNLFET